MSGYDVDDGEGYEEGVWNDIEEDKDKVLDQDRGYTDVPWLLFAFVLTVSTGVLASFAYEYCQRDVVRHGMDWRGQQCGLGDLSDAPLRGWVNPLFPDLNAGAVCLRSCPVTANGGQVSTWGTIMCICNPKVHADVSQPLTPLGAMCATETAKRYGYVFSNSYSSKSDISAYVTQTDNTDLLPCTFQFTTHEIMDMCVPALDPSNYELIVDQKCGPNGDNPDCGLQEELSGYLNDANQITIRIIADIIKCRWVCMICCGIAMVFSAYLYYLIQQPRGARIMLWTNIIWMIAHTACAAYSADYFLRRSEFTPTLPTQASDRFASYVLGTVAWVMGAGTIFMCILTLHWQFQSFNKSIVEMQGVDFGVDTTNNPHMLTTTETASRTLVLAGKALSLIGSSMQWSVTIQVITTIAILLVWYAIAFALVTSGIISIDKYGAHHLEFDHSLQWSMLFHIFGMCWLMELIDVIVVIVGGGVVALYVFAPTTDGQESDVRIFPDFPLWHSFATMGKFHLGTMVASATLLMIARPLRFFCDMIHLIRFGSGVPNSAWDQSKPDPHTCCGLLEIFYHRYILGLVRGTDKRALVQTVLHGTPFFSARSATWHLNKHYGKYMSVPLHASSTAQFITRNNIALSCAFIGHLLITSEWTSVMGTVTLNSLQSTGMPLLVIFVFGHVIGWAFMCHLDAAVVVEMVGYAEAKLRLYTPGVPQLTVPKDLILLCEEAQVQEAADVGDKGEETALVEQDQI